MPTAYTLIKLRNVGETIRCAYLPANWNIQQRWSTTSYHRENMTIPYFVLDNVQSVKKISLFWPEDGGSWLNRNKSKFLPDCTAWYPRRQ